MFNMMSNNIKWWLIVLLVLLPTNIHRWQEVAYQPSYSAKNTSSALPEYIVGIHPLHNPQRLIMLYGPIVDYMNSHIANAHFHLEASRNYAEFEKKLSVGHFAFVMSNPYQTLQSIKYGYRIFGKTGDDTVFHGIILVRKDSDIHTLTDLKGKSVAYPSETALIATMIPQYYLQMLGIDVNHDIENHYVGSQESSIMNVLRGHVAAATTWSVPWTQFSMEHPDMASQLVVKWETEPLATSVLNSGWAVHNTVPTPIAKQFEQLLFSLHESESGRIILKKASISHFEPITDEDYRPVRNFLKVFSETVRPIDH